MFFMRGASYYLTAAALFAASALNAEFYNLTVKTVAPQTDFPDAVFFIEPETMQMKGFEAQIKPVGFGGEGIKTITVQNQELRERLLEAMQKELSLKNSEKLDNLREKLLNACKRLEMAAGYPEEPEKAAGNKRGISPRRMKNDRADAAFMRNRAAARNMEAYEKAKAEFEAFDAQYQRAKRNKNVEKSLVAEIDEKIKARYDKYFSEAIIPDGTLPFGTFCAVRLKKVSGNTAVIDFEYAVSRMLGWIRGDGTNNNNMMNTSLDVEYIETPRIENVKIEIGKPYCFQIARPEEQTEGTLDQARNATSIFATENKTKTIDAGLAQGSKSGNPLTTHADYSTIRAKFKGKEKKVVRVVLTLTRY